MGESNAEWGHLDDDLQRDAWDSYDPIPEAGSHEILDAFVARKHISHGALVRVGARLKDHTVLAFAFPGGIKYRDIVTGKRWSYFGSQWHSLKIVPGSSSNGSCIVAEGETDGCWLTDRYPCDVALMPAGARHWTDTYTDQVKRYEKLYIGLDNDEAGEAGALLIRRAVPSATRHAPPHGANDWCSLDPALEPPPLPEAPAKSSILVPAGDLLQLEAPDNPSWFEGAVLPIAGSAIIHGSYKSLKTWVALDLAASIAQGVAWAGFESTEEPGRVAYFNFEVPWSYYKARVRAVLEHAPKQELAARNFFTYSPLTRPRLVAGNAASEDAIIQDLLDTNINVAVIDPVRRAVGLADLNAENEVRRMLHFAQRLNDHGITAVLVHHDNKASDRFGGGDPSGMTGSGAFAGDADTIVSIIRPSSVRRDELKRNVRFLMRNAPAPPVKAFELGDNGRLAWTDDAIITSEDGDAEL